MKLKSISREEQLESWRRRYHGRGPEGRSRLLDELCEEHGYHRKHAIPLLNGTAVSRKSPPDPERQYGAIAELVERKLTDQVSAATLDRLLAPMRFRHLRGLSGTKPGSLLRQQIPIQREVWDEDRGGFLEADSVAHCGSSLAGSFVRSLTYTDIASTWTSGRAVWNKGAAGVLEQTRLVEQDLPFAFVGHGFRQRQRVAQLASDSLSAGTL